MIRSSIPCKAQEFLNLLPRLLISIIVSPGNIFLPLYLHINRHPRFEITLGIFYPNFYSEDEFCSFFFHVYLFWSELSLLRYFRNPSPEKSVREGVGIDSGGIADSDFPYIYLWNIDSDVYVGKVYDYCNGGALNH